jgi:S1-C subfamily serine protease
MLTLFLLLLSPVDPPKAYDSPPKAYDKSPPKAVGATKSTAVDAGEAYWFAARVTVELDGKTNVGSGTTLAHEGGRALVLTNAHVVPRAAKGGVITVAIRGRDYPATYVAGSVVDRLSETQIRVNGPDLALLEIEADLPGGASLRTEPLAAGESVYHWGYGGSKDNKPVMRNGVLVESKVVGSLATTAGSEPGDSGAGVFDTHGRLVGVVWGGSSSEDYAVGLLAVGEFVSGGLPQKRFPLFADKLDKIKARLADAPRLSPRVFDPPFIPRLNPTCPDGNCPTYVPRR